MDPSIEDFDWAATPLGTPAQWPRMLRHTVDIVMRSRQPMYVAWGPDLITVFNPAYRKILGRRPEAFGRPLREVIGVFDQIRHLVDEVLSGRPTWVENMPVTTRRFGIKETAHFSFSFTPLRDDSGEVGGYFAVVTETSGTLRHAVRLADERDRLRELFENAPGFMAMTSGPDHRFVLANRSYKKLVGREDLVGKTVMEALPELESQGFPELLDHVYATGEPVQGEEAAIRLDRRQGAAPEELAVTFVYQPVRGRDGSVVGLFVEGFDVTDMKRARDELKLLQNELIHVSRISAMGTMASTLAHELNQPLTSIASYLAGAEAHLTRAEGELSRTEVATAVTEARKSALRAGRIIERLRGLTVRGRPQSGRVDIADLVAETVGLARSGREAGSVRTIVRVSDALEADCDRVQIQQVLLNLIRNALEAMVEAPRQELSVIAERKGATVEIAVSDSGTGVAAEVKDRLFEPFATTKPTGMGVGLSICRTIVEAHRGRIWASENEQGGATFTFTLPAVMG